MNPTLQSLAGACPASPALWAGSLPAGRQAGGASHLAANGGEIVLCVDS
jgi:hypothetical protein